MADTNPHTGDAMRSKPTTPAFREGHELIWGKKPAPQPPAPAPK